MVFLKLLRGIKVSRIIGPQLRAETRFFIFSVIAQGRFAAISRELVFAVQKT